MTELEPGTFAASVSPPEQKDLQLPLGDVVATPGQTAEVTLRLPPEYGR